MRLLHCSDFHIGVAKHGIDRRLDHDHVFAQIKALAIEEAVDVILNTGDFFESANPSTEVLLYAWSVLEDLASVAPVVLLCGNHDSAKLFEFIRTVLQRRLPIYLVDPASVRDESGRILILPTRDGKESIRIGAVPFIKHIAYVRDTIYREHPERATASYADMVGEFERHIGDLLNQGYDHRTDHRIFAAHLHVEGAMTSGSEFQMYVENGFATKVSTIPQVEYAAFGHIHKPQRVGENGRYAGSPIPIDFGERDDQKVVYLVTGKPGYAPQIEERSLDVGRKLAYINMSLDELRAARDNYVGMIAKVTVTLDAPVPDLDAQVREILSSTIVPIVMPRYTRAEDEIVITTQEGDVEPTLGEMFSGFLASREDIGDAPRVGRYFDALLDAVASDSSADVSLATIGETEGAS